MQEEKESTRFKFNLSQSKSIKESNISSFPSWQKKYVIKETELYKHNDLT